MRIAINLRALNFMLGIVSQRSTMSIQKVKRKESYRATCPHGKSADKLRSGFTCTFLLATGPFPPASQSRQYICRQLAGRERESRMNTIELAYAFREAGYKGWRYPVPLREINSAHRDFLRMQYRSGTLLARTVDQGTSLDVALNGPGAGLQPKNEAQGALELQQDGYEAQCPHIDAMRRDDKSHDLWALKVRRPGRTVPAITVCLVALECDSCAAEHADITEWRVPYRLITEEQTTALLQRPDIVPLNDWAMDSLKRAAAGANK
jgi:hypothetical protein